jgi:hypothetical protein
MDELKKQGVKFTPKQETRLMPLFEEEAGELVNLSHTIDTLNTELDELVFELYGLSEDERDIIRNCGQ